MSTGIPMRPRFRRRRPFNNRLTTAEIIYHLPDYPHILQSFVWQFADLAPAFPKLMHFLDYWDACLEGKIHSVQVAHASLVKPRDITHIDGSWTLQ